MPQTLEFLHKVGADGLGTGKTFRTTSNGTTTSLVTTQLVNSVLAPTEFATDYVLIESGACKGQVAQIKAASLAKTTGTVSTAQSFTTAILSGVTFSIWRLAPPIPCGDRPSILEAVQQAHQRSDVEDTIYLTGVNGQYHYTADQSVYPWFDDDTRIIDVLRPVTSSDDIPCVYPRSLWDWVSDGETRKLRFRDAPWKTGDSFGVKVNRPASSRLKLNAHVRAVLTSTAVSSVMVDLGGYYTALPTIAPASGAATFTAVMAATPGPITSVTVTAGGTYTADQPPALTVTRHASDTGWADTTAQDAGLLSLTDEAIPSTHNTFMRAMALFYRNMAALDAPGADVEEWLGKSNAWASVVANNRARRSPRDRLQGVVGGRFAGVGTYRD